MKNIQVNLKILAYVGLLEDEIVDMFDDIVFYIDDRVIDENVLWNLDFEIDKNKSICEQIEIILLHLIESNINKIIKKIVTIYFDVQVYYDTYTCSFSIPSECIEKIANKSSKIGIEFSTYPTEFSDSTINTIQLN